MKKIIYVVCLTAIVTGLISCGNSAVTLEEVQKEIMLHPGNSFISSPGITVLHNPDQSTSLALYDKERHSLAFFDTYGTELQNIILQLPDSLKSKIQTLYAQAISADSILLLEKGTKTIFLFNAKGELMRTFIAATNLSDGSNDYCLLAMNQCPFRYDGENIYATCTRLDMIVRTPEARKKYFSTPPDIVTNIATGKQNNSGIWPAEYKSGASFRDFYPQRCINRKKEIVYGFAASDSIYVLKNGKLISKHNCKSKYMTERHTYPDDSLGHFFFLEKYSITEPVYVNLIYDPYRNFYYRIVHHAIPFENKNGFTVNTFSDKVWSLMLLNEDFEVLNEISFDPHQHLPAVFPTTEGVLVKRNPGENSHGNISFALFKIIE
ncbi:MAG: DUF4221 domain-containing protein [Bacteroidota bacterium]|nr:DUF4221 domain-containing protein [Bacteroidota bacterium]